MRADARANRDAIIAAARKLFAANGRDVPAQTIATEAGVGIATYYRHFPTIEELLLAVVQNVVEDIATLEKRHRNLLAADPAAGWWAYLQDMAALRLGALLPLLGPEAFDGTIIEMRSQAMESVQRVVQVARAGGQVRDGSDAVYIQLGIGRITRPLHPAATEMAPDHEAWMLEVFHRGLLPG